MEKGMIRDLTKNTAILHEDKMNKAIETFRNGPQELEECIYGKEAYNLKFGFMNSQICLSYLVRIEPYSSLFIEYNGKLDHPDRMLNDCIGLWKKVFKSPQCNSELIPEWFYLPQIYTNKNHCYFGRDSKDKVVSDVVLPQWANENPFYYCMKFREFIDGIKYPKTLNVWIDMMFGKRQQNPDDMNVFFSFATQEYYDKASEKEVTSEMIKSTTEFFQLPKQLFQNNHKVLGKNNQADNEESKGGRSPLGTESVEEVKSEDIKIMSDETVSNTKCDKDQYSRSVNILSGNLKSHEDTFHLVWRTNKQTPMICVEKMKKGTVPSPM